MKRNFKFVLATILTLVTFLPFLSVAQYSPSVHAGFGVDCEVISRHSKNITSSTLTTADWFKPSANGTGVLSTTGLPGFTTCEPFF